MKGNSQPGRVFTKVSQRSVGPCRGGSRPDLAEASADQGVPRRQILHRLRALNDRINNCWVGDLIGVAALAVLLVQLTFIVGILQ